MPARSHPVRLATQKSRRRAGMLSAWACALGLYWARLCHTAGSSTPDAAGAFGYGRGSSGDDQGPRAASNCSLTPNNCPSYFDRSANRSKQNRSTRYRSKAARQARARVTGRPFVVPPFSSDKHENESYASGPAWSRHDNGGTPGAAPTRSQRRLIYCTVLARSAKLPTPPWPPAMRSAAPPTGPPAETLQVTDLARMFATFISSISRDPANIARTMPRHRV
jgi:hypothetical protein